MDQFAFKGFSLAKEQSKVESRRKEIHKREKQEPNSFTIYSQGALQFRKSLLPVFQ